MAFRSVLCVLALLAGAVAATDLQTVDLQMEDSSYDYFLYVLSWPQSVCFTSPTGQCLPAGNQFIIHGLWPSRNDTSYPSFCTQEAFDANQISDLLSYMQIAWTDMFPNQGYEFWSHEWTKHGTCSLDVAPTQHQYFSDALNLYKQYNYTAAVFQNGISTGGNGFPLSTYQRAFQSYFGVTPYLSCLNKNGVHYMHQIGLCFDKNLNMYQCNSAILKQGGCNASYNAILPDPQNN